MTRARLTRKSDGLVREVTLSTADVPERVTVTWSDGRHGTIPIASLRETNSIEVLD